MSLDRPATASPRTKGPLPNFFIIGAPKAGTTSLSEYLSEHPQAFVAPQKEVYFFSRFWDNGVDWYRDQFRKAGDARAVGEATPTYMYRDDALTRMAELVPEAKLVAILRDPVDRLYSDYWYLLPLGEKRTFEEVVRQEMADGTTKLQRVGYLDAGRYVRNLRRVCEYFPRSSLLVLLTDDLRTDPEGTYATLCRHLGIDPAFVPREVGRAKNQAYRLRWPALRTFMWRNRMGKRMPRLSKRLEAINRKAIRYPKMDPALRAELKAWYAADNAELAAWLGRDLSSWS